MAQYGAPSQKVLSPTTSSHRPSSVSAGSHPSLIQAQSLAGVAGLPTATSRASEGATAAAAQLAQHKRVYQACIPCRRRKVRCDLGSVDNPHDPPCVRCRRESKECYFSATRRKRRADDPEEEPERDDYIIRNGRKQLRTSDAGFDRRTFSEAPLTPGGSHGRAQPLKRPGTDGLDGERTEPQDNRNPDEDEPNAQLENLEAQSVMRTGVYGPHDALDLLYKAATNKFVTSSPRQPLSVLTKDSGEILTGHARRHDDNLHHATPSSISTLAAQPGARPDVSRHSSHRREDSVHARHMSLQDQAADQPIDPELTRPDSEDNLGHASALRAWTRFRFVRAGWFTAQEAIDYIEYYYAYLSPLTPISPPTFRNPASHITLLIEEPILAVTLLTIASRYRRLQGTGGHCRSHAIHEQLWNYLRGMIERVIWGQESFGGGFCGSGADDGWNPGNSADENWTSTTAPWRGLRKGSLRTLGTIESLLLLTEWHPRSLHFPPQDATDELMLPVPFSRGPNSHFDEAGPPHPPVQPGRRIEGWLEPAWRSDRMSWMLLSTGMGLAYELGVFDDIEELLATGNITRPEYEEEDYRVRASRIKRLLIIYISQLSGRLGWTNMVPESLRKSDLPMKKRPHSGDGATPGTNQSSMSSAFNYIPDLELDDQIIHCWAGISNAMQYGNEKLFKSRQHTTDIIQSGRYIHLLKEFQPILNDWWQQFDRFRLPPFIRHILTIEYEYVRIYVFSLALQAVVERSTANASGGGGGGNAPGGSVSGQSGPQLSPQTQNYYGKLPLGRLGGFGTEDQEYVKAVNNGSRNLLKTVVEGLRPDDYLKHVPVRTYFRIISGAMFLLKTFAVGAPKNEIEVSIQLMDQTVDALRNCVVDDVHLGIRFADMLEQLTGRLRNRFIHAPPAPPGEVRSPGKAPHDTGMSGTGSGAPNGADWGKRDGVVGPEHTSTPANISARPWDLTTGHFPFPPGSSSMFEPSTPAAHHGLPDGAHASASAGNNGNAATNLGFDTSGFDNSDWNNPGNEMWYLPPGPALFQNMENSAVAMTAEGVHVGGLDLLEYMVMDDFGAMEGYQP